jgi:NADP-dependent 3-hydroxy acid dehydrogenase YdfG
LIVARSSGIGRVASAAHAVGARVALAARCMELVSALASQQRIGQYFDVTDPRVIDLRRLLVVADLAETMITTDTWPSAN